MRSPIQTTSSTPRDVTWVGGRFDPSKVDAGILKPGPSRSRQAMGAQTSSQAQPNNLIRGPPRMDTRKANTAPPNGSSRQALLHQHRQTDHALAHVGDAAGQIDAQSRRERDHRRPSASSTRRSARPSTSASTRSDTPLGSMISISPPARAVAGGPGGAVSPIGAGSDAPGEAGARSTSANRGMARSITGSAAQQLLPPRIELAGADGVLARDLGRRQPQAQALRDDLALLLQRPRAPALAPRDDLDRPVACALTTSRMSALAPIPASAELRPSPPCITARARAAMCRRHDAYAIPLHGVAFASVDFDTPSLSAQGRQRRLPYFNIVRDIPRQPAWGALTCGDASLPSCLGGVRQAPPDSVPIDSFPVSPLAAGFLRNRGYAPFNRDIRISASGRDIRVRFSFHWHSQRR